MPFELAFDDVYQLGIKRAADAAGAYAERVDEQIFNESILQRVYNQIAKADLIVADMTGRNPNVFYEVGYAHALGKTVVLLTTHADDIPFDLKHYPHIVYGGRIVELKRELEKRLRFLIRRGFGGESELTPGSLRIQIGDVLLENCPVVKFLIPSDRIGYEIPVDIHNSLEREIATITCQVGLVTSEIFGRAEIDH